MSETLQVDSTVEDGVMVLSVTLGKELLFSTGAGSRLSDDLLTHYRDTLEKDGKALSTKSCIVDIQSEVAGSPLVRALYNLWEEVFRNQAGQVICVNYPDEYIDSLTSLGLPSLPGFSLDVNKTQAIKRLTATTKLSK